MNRWISIAALLFVLRIVDVTVNSGVILAGKDLRIAVTIDPPAPAGGQTITVACDPDRVYTVPAPIQVAARAKSGWVTLRPRPVRTTTPLLITFTAEDSSKSVEVKVEPAMLFRLLSDWTATGGTAVRLSAMFAGIPAAGEMIALTSDDPAALPVPRSIPADGGELRLRSARLTEAKQITITATYQGVTKTAGVVLQPLILAGITGPADAMGGSRIKLDIKLTQAAVLGDEVVKLVSSHPSVAKVPPMLTIPANATAKSLDIVLGRVRAPKMVTITATLGSVRKSFTLEVKPKP